MTIHFLMTSWCNYAGLMPLANTKFWCASYEVAVYSSETLISIPTIRSLECVGPCRVLVLANLSPCKKSNVNYRRHRIAIEISNFVLLRRFKLVTAAAFAWLALKKQWESLQRYHPPADQYVVSPLFYFHHEHVKPIFACGYCFDYHFDFATMGPGTAGQSGANVGGVDRHLFCNTGVITPICK